MGFKARKEVLKRFQGMSSHRYRDNPVEKAFALAWQEAHMSPIGEDRGYLHYLMDRNNRGYPGPPLTERDFLVAATVIQWLGSPVGQGWLAEVLGRHPVCDFHWRYRHELAGSTLKAQ